MSEEKPIMWVYWASRGLAGMEQIPDFIAEKAGESGDYEAAMEGLGYSKLDEMADPHIAEGVEVWSTRRKSDDAYPYIAILTLGGSCFYVVCNTFPDLLGYLRDISGIVTAKFIHMWWEAAGDMISDRAQEYDREKERRRRR